MNTLVLEADPQVIDVSFTDDKFSIALSDGRFLLVPLSWYPRLHHATSAEHNNWQLLGDGYAVEWPDLDEHIGIEGLLAGRRSGESKRSLERWLEKRSPAE
ncbi:MAG: DUF2442 domain-containing protein [Anaerolineaceae bacterium]|nr:DUF2442 domain-containing protein [Anaerolineaceae bacterium]